MAASSSNQSQKQLGGNKAVEMEEIVRHMSNLPSYLERGKPIQDRALNFGVMDWGRLEKWQYHRQKQGVTGNNRYSPSSSNASLLSSTDGSSPRSIRGQSSSPAPMKPNHVTLKSHLNVSGNVHESRDVKDALVNHSSKKKSTNRSRTKPRDCKKNDSHPRNLPESNSSDNLESFQTASSSSSSKGKMKIEDELVNERGNFRDLSYGTCNRELFERHKTLVLLPRDAPGNSQTNNDVPRSFPLETEVVNQTNSQNEADSKSKSPEDKEFSVSSKNSDIKTVTVAASKLRNISPRRRFSFSTSSTTTKTADSTPVSQNSTKHTSPLRRLLDPLFSSKSSYTKTPPEDTKTKPKVKLDFGSCKEVKIDDSCRNNYKTNESSSTKQALFQMAIKNGRPLFTFAVDNNVDILAATVRSLNGKDNNSWVYTFFTIHEVKKTKSGWLSHGPKGTGQGFLPNVTAQMRVLNPSISNGTTREFVLSTVDPGRLDHEMLDAEPQDELAAIVVRFLRKTDEEENRDCFSTTVILPGGHHSVPSKGEPSPLIERWRSGGVCDCGGWDVGCRLRTLTNELQSDRISNSHEANTTSGKFDLFFQGDVINERPFFSFSPLKEGIFSVEYNSSLSLLHAFSICISVIECRKSSQHTEAKTYVAKQVDDNDDAPVTYTSLPPLSPVGRV